MVLKKPLYMQPAEGDAEIEYSAVDYRSLLHGLFRSDGILRPDTVAGGLKVSQRAAGADLSVDVAAGRAIIEGDSVADQGKYFCWSTDVVNVGVPAPPASGSRTHIVVARLYDKLHDGGSAYEWTIELVEDDGSGVPAVPGSAIPLAQVAVAAGQTSVTDANITDTRFNTRLIGGQAPQAFSDASRPPVPYTSEVIWRTDTGLFEVYDGSTWRVLGPPPAPKQIESATTISGFTNSAYAAGTPACGDTFKAPSTGRVYITVSGRLSSSSNGQQAFLSYEIRTGTTVGSGTVAQAASDDRALATSRAVNTGAASYLSASRRQLVEGLTGGADYNIRTMHKVTGGSGGTDYRALLIEPA